MITAELSFGFQLQDNWVCEMLITFVRLIMISKIPPRTRTAKDINLKSLASGHSLSEHNARSEGERRIAFELDRVVSATVKTHLPTNASTTMHMIHK